MRRLNLVLLASLQLCGARSRGFTVFEDLLTFPQFEVSIADGWISEQDAQALLNSNAPQPTYGTDLSRSTQTGSHDGAHEDAATGKKAYEVMRLSSNEYLCSIPQVRQANAESETDSELAKAEEARELSRATTHGWELLSGLGDQCLLFMSGWWTYRFCKNREIVQFHVSAAAAAQQAPTPDPHTVEYVLGAVPAIPTSAMQKSRRDANTKPLPAELQIKGDQRYLVQKLEGGTICDLTGRARTIEVQYHCVPGLKQDRISWIKEVTICAYLMVVNTPRLCEDVAFLPPKEAKANRIDCQLIIHEDKAQPLIDQTRGDSKPSDVSQEQKEAKEANPLQKSPLSRQDPAVVGGIVVGARHVLSSGDEEGKPPITLKSPRDRHTDLTPDKFVELIAQAASKADGGKIEALTREEMEDLDIDPKVIEEMKAELKKLAGDGGWRLEIVELPNGDVRELRGYVDGEEEDEDEDEEEGDDAGSGKDDGGSEEKFYKDEL